MNGRRLGRRAARGITLHEMLVVIAIMSLLMAILSPNFRMARKQAKYARWLSYSRQLHNETIGYWDFEDKEGVKLSNRAQGLNVKAYDPLRLDGRIHGIAEPWTQGRWPKKGALWFDGVFTYVDCGAHPRQPMSNPHGKDLTFGAWVYVYYPQSVGYVLDTGGSSDNHTGIAIAIDDDGNGYFSYHTGDGTYEHDFTIEIANEEWVHLAAVFDSAKAELRVYRNGELAADESAQPTQSGGGKGSGKGGGKGGGKAPPQTPPTPTTTARNPSEKVMVGASQDGSSRFRGAIDEVFIADRAWPEHEIRGHYRMGKP